MGAAHLCARHGRHPCPECHVPVGLRIAGRPVVPMPASMEDGPRRSVRAHLTEDFAEVLSAAMAHMAVCSTPPAGSSHERLRRALAKFGVS
jgi:hypothetical protein